MTDYLMDAANQAIGLANSLLEPEAERVAETLRAACTALGMLEADEHFFRALVQQQRVAAIHQNACDQMLRDAYTFANGFLRIEQEVLIQTGLDATAVAFLGERAKDLYDTLGGRFEQLDADEVRDAIRRLRALICDLANELRPGVQRTRRRTRVRRILGNVAFGVGGAAVVVANVSASGFSIGVSTLSTMIGGKFVGSAVEKLTA